jgi:hypothetical protein
MAKQAIDGIDCAPVGVGVVHEQCQVRDCPCDATQVLQTKNYLDGTPVCDGHAKRHAKLISCIDADKKELETFGGASPSTSIPKEECNEDCTSCKKDVGNDFICQTSRKTARLGRNT